MTADAILTLSFAIIALTLKPGPGMVLLLSHTISQGVRGCLGVLLGAQIVNIVFLIIVFAGFNFIDVDIIFISICVKSVAAVYLIWVGFKGLQEFTTSFEIEPFEQQGFFDSLLASMTLTASNPLVIIFYAGIFPTILDVNAMILTDIVLIIAIIAVVEAGVAACYSLPFAFFRYKMTPSVLQKMRIFSSVAIILVGLYIAYSALPAKDLLSVF